jgi:hypothetical protein
VTAKEEQRMEKTYSKKAITYETAAKMVEAAIAKATELK